MPRRAKPSSVGKWQQSTEADQTAGHPSPNHRLTGDPRAILDFIGNPGNAMAPTFRFLLALCTLVLTVHSPVAQAGEPVDSLLVLAADVSRSIDQPKFQLQREGYAAAISHPRVLNAIASGLHHRIAVCFVEWSGVGAQKVVIDWTLISDAGAARRFSDQLLEAPRSFADRTSISGAIDFAASLFDRAPYDSTRRTIDISGDGNNNSGRDVSAARDDAVAQNITINGLVILTDMPLSWNSEHTNPPGGLANYYGDNVIGGPGAFVIVAENFNSFQEAITKKMIAEVADGSPQSDRRLIEASAGAR